MYYAKLKVNTINSSNLKKELLNKLKIVENKINHRVIETTAVPMNTNKAGILMGRNHDRQDLGVQLQKGTKITVRQTNLKYTGNLTIRLLSNASSKESAATFGSGAVTLTAKNLVAAFIDTPYNQVNGERPEVSYTIEGDYLPLPVYTYGTDENLFRKLWNDTAGYGLFVGKRFRTFLPNVNRTTALSKNLNEYLDLYDNKILGYYNNLIGLSDNNPNPINRSSERKYFYKADANGTGALYYGGYWAAETSTSAASLLNDGWDALHETGHGYQGSFMNRGMDVGEVWNNIYGVIYNYNHLGKDKADKSTGHYNFGNKERLENVLKNTIMSGSANYNNQDLRKKIIILSNFIDKAGNECLSNFYQKYRELADKPGFNPNNYTLPDLLVSYLVEPKKYDFTPVFNSWGLDVSKGVKDNVKKQEFQQVAHLVQVVPDYKLDEAIKKFTSSNRLSSYLSLVTNDELGQMNLKSTVTLNLVNEELFRGTKLRILNGDIIYKEVTLGQGKIELTNIPNGVYSLELQTDSGYINKPYLFVRDNGTITITLDSYLKDAQNAVNNLFENNTDKIKNTLMQSDINQVKSQVNKLPNSSEKKQLLKKIDVAFNQLQEFSFKGLGNWEFARLDVASGVATIRTYSGTPHSYFNDCYACIIIKRYGSTILDKKYIGNQNYPSKIESVELKDGDEIMITHREANYVRLSINHSD